MSYYKYEGTEKCSIDNAKIKKRKSLYDENGEITDNKISLNNILKQYNKELHDDILNNFDSKNTWGVTIANSFPNLTFDEHNIYYKNDDEIYAFGGYLNGVAQKGIFKYINDTFVKIATLPFTSTNFFYTVYADYNLVYFYTVEDVIKGQIDYPGDSSYGYGFPTYDVARGVIIGQGSWWPKLNDVTLPPKTGFLLKKAYEYNISLNTFTTDANFQYLPPYIGKLNPTTSIYKFPYTYFNQCLYDVTIGDEDNKISMFYYKTYNNSYYYSALTPDKTSTSRKINTANVARYIDTFSINSDAVFGTQLITKGATVKIVDYKINTIDTLDFDMSFIYEKDTTGKRIIYSKINSDSTMIYFFNPSNKTEFYGINIKTKKTYTFLSDTTMYNNFYDSMSMIYSDNNKQYLIYGTEKYEIIFKEQEKGIFNIQLLPAEGYFSNFLSDYYISNSLKQIYLRRNNLGYGYDNPFLTKQSNTKKAEYFIKTNASNVVFNNCFYSFGFNGDNNAVVSKYNLNPSTLNKQIIVDNFIDDIATNLDAYYRHKMIVSYNPLSHQNSLYVFSKDKYFIINKDDTIFSVNGQHIFSLPSNLISDISDCSVVNYNGTIHILGNGRLHIYLNQFTNAWQVASTLPYDFYNGAALVYNGAIYIISTYKMDETSTDADKAKMYKWLGTGSATNSWTSIATLPDQAIKHKYTGYKMNSLKALDVDNSIMFYTNYSGGMGSPVDYAHIWDGLSSSTASFYSIRINSYDGSSAPYNKVTFKGKLYSNNERERFLLPKADRIAYFADKNQQQVVLHDKLHILGGNPPVNLQNGGDPGWCGVHAVKDKNGDIFFYNSLPFPFHASGAVNCQDKLYLLGSSWTTSVYGKHFYRWEEDDDTWTRLNDLPYAVGYTSAVEYKGKIHLFGSTASGYNNAHYMWDPESGAWTNTGQGVPVAKGKTFYSKIISDKNKIYFLGTGSTKSDFKLAAYYQEDPNTGIGSWVKMAGLPFDCYYGIPFIYRDKVHLLGGAHSSFTKSHFMYDEIAGTYTLLSRPLTGILDGVGNSTASFTYRNDCGYFAMEFNDEIDIFGGVTNLSRTRLKFSDGKPALPDINLFVEYPAK